MLVGKHCFITTPFISITPISSYPQLIYNTTSAISGRFQPESPPKDTYEGVTTSLTASLTASLTTTTPQTHSHPWYWQIRSSWAQLKSGKRGRWSWSTRQDSRLGWGFGMSKDQEWGGVLCGIMWYVSSVSYFWRTLSLSGGGVEEKVERVSFTSQELRK